MIPLKNNMSAVQAVVALGVMACGCGLPLSDV